MLGPYRENCVVDSEMEESCHIWVLDILQEKNFMIFWEDQDSGPWCPLSRSAKFVVSGVWQCSFWSSSLLSVFSLKFRCRKLTLIQNFSWPSYWSLSSFSASSADSPRFYWIFVKGLPAKSWKKRKLQFCGIKDSCVCIPPTLHKHLNHKSSYLILICSDIIIVLLNEFPFTNFEVVSRYHQLLLLWILLMFLLWSNYLIFLLSR